MKTYLLGLLLMLVSFGEIGYSTIFSNDTFTSFSAAQSTISSNESNTSMTTQPIPDSLELATFGAGCFWCVEAIYELVEGIHYVESGYSGGHVETQAIKKNHRTHRACGSSAYSFRF